MTQVAVGKLYPGQPADLFMERVPHGYSDRRTILADVAAGGFSG